VLRIAVKWHTERWPQGWMVCGASGTDRTGDNDALVRPATTRFSTSPTRKAAPGRAGIVS